VEKKEKYPFVPKSTSYMKEGQFWDIPLSNGKFACGRVLQFDFSRGKKNSRGFLAGLIDWVGESLPTSDAIAGAKLLEQGKGHIRMIEFNRGQIRGFRPLELDNMKPFLELDQMPVNNCFLTSGFERLRLATLEERMSLYIGSTWGLGVIKIAAEAYFIKKRQPYKQRLPWEELQEHKKTVMRLIKEIKEKQ
jgi:hypothetical protein